MAERGRAARADDARSASARGDDGLMRVSRPVRLALALALGTTMLGLAACGGSPGPSSPPEHVARADRPAAASERESGADAERRAYARLQPQSWHTDFTRHRVPFSDFEPGGPGADGIPPIDHPRFVTQRRADAFLDPREPVIAVVQGGHARAYPLQILVWHEIVNDRLGGRPIAVTYCPLCNSAVVFDRRAAGRLLDFGTTGLLRNSDLVMWDRQTQSWWQQFNGEALVGELTGQKLRPLPEQTLSWRDFKARYPGGDVLSRKTGFDRPYGDSPYQGYDSRDRPLFSPNRNDGRLPPFERVAAIRVGRDTAVVPFTRLAREPVVHARVGKRPAVVLFKRGVVSVLDMGYIPESRDVGTVGVFDRRIRGRVLRFVPAGEERFTDTQTGTHWDVTGRAVGGRLRGAQLRPLPNDQQFWFALAAFLPDARILRG